MSICQKALSAYCAEFMKRVLCKAAMMQHRSGQRREGCFLGGNKWYLSISPMRCVNDLGDKVTLTTVHACTVVSLKVISEESSWRIWDGAQVLLLNRHVISRRSFIFVIRACEHAILFAKGAEANTALQQSYVLPGKLRSRPHFY